MMETMYSYPLVSIIMATFNRAHTIERAVNSVLNQSYNNIELIIVDDGSKDHSVSILEKYEDSRIKIFKHEANKGSNAAKNTGLRHINGEWFTIFDSDDELVPDAIDKLIKIPIFFDSSITAVTCNCMDSSTLKISGYGLSNDQYVDIRTLMNCTGEFWGITKTSLLQNDIFNENFSGMEGILWSKIDDRAKRYYLHLPLRIYHTEGSDRLVKVKKSSSTEVKYFENLIHENSYLNKIKLYRPVDYYNLCKQALIVMQAAGNKKLAEEYYNMSSNRKTLLVKLLYKFKFLSIMLLGYKNLKFHFRNYIQKQLK